MAWWVDQFKTLYPTLDLRVLCNSGTDEELASRLLGDSVPVIRTESGTGVRECAWAAEKLGLDTIVFVSYGFILTPYGLLASALEHHLLEHNDWTPLVGLPDGVVLSIFRTQHLRSLAKLDIPGLSQEQSPQAMLSQMLFVSQQSGLDLPIPVTAVPFRFLDKYAVDEGELPTDVLLESGADIETLRKVVDSPQFTSGGILIFNSGAVAQSSSLDKNANGSSVNCHPSVK